MKQYLHSYIFKAIIVLFFLIYGTGFVTSCKEEECAQFDPSCDYQGFAYMLNTLNSLNEEDDVTRKHFVAVGNDGVIWTSEDGKERLYSIISPINDSNFPDDYDLNAVAYGDGVYVAVGNNGIVLYSEDGYNWNETFAGSPVDVANNYYHFLDVEWGDDRFIAVGCKPDDLAPETCETTVAESPLPVLRWSKDGIHWSSFSIPPTNANDSSVDLAINRIVYGNDVFVAYDAVTTGKFGSYTYSPLTDAWLPQEALTDAVLTAAHGTETFVVLGDSFAKYMADSDVLSGSYTDASNPPAGIFNGLVYGNGKFVAVGVTVAPASAIAVSNKGSNWTSVTNVCGSTLKGVAYGNDTFVAVGQSLTSGYSVACVNDDGSASSWTPFGDTGTGLNDVIYVERPPINGDEKEEILDAEDDDSTTTE